MCPHTDRRKRKNKGLLNKDLKRKANKQNDIAYELKKQSNQKKKMLLKNGQSIAWGFPWSFQNHFCGVRMG